MHLPILQIVNLSKTFHDWEHLRFRPIPVLKSISLEVQKGEIFGFLGPNGAGKTTTIKTLMGIIRPTSGTARILGHDLVEHSQEVKKRTGFLPENPYFYDYLKVGEFVEFCGSLFGQDRAFRRRRAAELLEMVGMSHAANLPLRKCSKGMLQRTGIAQSLVNDPDFLVWDEPVSGLDPIGRKEIKDLMLDLRRRGKTIFFSSHILPDAEALCDRVAIIINGEVNTIGTLPELMKDAVSWVEIVAEDLKQGFKYREATVENVANQTIFKIKDIKHLDNILKAIIEKKGRVISVTPQRENLETYFARQVKARGRKPG
jgi:ABC-2 type transport system ATP-binding protein